MSDKSIPVEDLRLMVLALLNGWEAQKVSLYDEETVEGWRWRDPKGTEYDVIGDWSFPELDERTRNVMRDVRR